MCSFTFFDDFFRMSLLEIIIMQCGAEFAELVHQESFISCIFQIPVTFCSTNQLPTLLLQNLQ